MRCSSNEPLIINEKNDWTRSGRHRSHRTRKAFRETTRRNIKRSMGETSQENQMLTNFT